VLLICIRFCTQKAQRNATNKITAIFVKLRT